jgi:hypothetical protein
MPSYAGTIICTAGDSLSRPEQPEKSETVQMAMAANEIAEGEVIPQIERVMSVKLGVLGRC